MKLNEFFTYGQDGFEQDKTYEPENDISVLDAEDTRKTRLRQVLFSYLWSIVFLLEYFFL